MAIYVIRSRVKSPRYDPFKLGMTAVALLAVIVVIAIA